MRLIKSAISPRNWLVREFAVTIATIGSAIIATTTRMARNTSGSIGLGWRNYIPVRLSAGEDTREPVETPKPKVPTTIKVAVSASSASSATRPVTVLSRQAHKPAQRILRDESASPSRRQLQRQSASRYLERDSRASFQRRHRTRRRWTKP